MPTTVREAESAVLAAKARTTRWITRFLREWNAPMLEAVLMDYWQTLPDEVRAQLQERHPDAYREVEAKLRNLIEQRGGG